MTSFPYLSPELTGTAYYKHPDKRAVVFDTVPVLAEQAKKVYPKVEEPVDWPNVYTITPIAGASPYPRCRPLTSPPRASNAATDGQPAVAGFRHQSAHRPLRPNLTRRHQVRVH